MERRKAIYSIYIEGSDVSSGFVSVVTSITVKDSAGQSADTANIDLDNSNSQISFPRVGVKMAIGLGWEGTAPILLFEGLVDEVRSTGGRGQGRMMSISAKSADTRGKLKEPKEEHKDRSSLGDVASAWGKDAGLNEVKVHPDLAKIERPYWSMENESFLQWGARVAKEVGATFKVMGERAVMTPRSSGKSASGKGLPKIRAEWGRNLISWSISPILSRPAFKKFEARYYDPKEAKWRRETFEAKEVSEGIEASSTLRFVRADKETAKAESESYGNESDREKGGGSVTIDGDPTAQAEAECELIGTDPGVDGTYRIETATHNYTRSGGYTTDLDLKQPKGDAGKDNRKSEKAGSAVGSAKTLTSKNNSAVNTTDGGNSATA